MYQKQPGAILDKEFKEYSHMSLNKIIKRFEVLGKLLTLLPL